MIVNIVYHSLTTVGGGERHVLETVRVLREAGWSPRLVVCGYDPRVPQTMGYDPDSLEVLDVCPRGPRPSLLVSLPRGLSKARGKLENADVHLVFQGIATTWARPPESPVRILYSLSPPRFIHDPTIRSIAPAWKKPLLAAARILAPIDKRSIQYYNHYIANSRVVARRLARAYGLGEDKVSILYPPVDTQRYRYEGHQGFILVVSRLQAHKGVTLTLQVARKARDRMFIIVGGGPLLGKLRRRAEELGNVQVLGRVPEDVLIDLYARTDLLLYTPVNEDLGLAPIEAAASGKPTVGVREGGLLETVVHGRTGYLLERDPDRIAEVVRRLDTQALEKMAPACIQHSKRFDTRIYMNRLVETIETVLRK